MREFWVMIGGDETTMCHVIRTWAPTLAAVQEAFPNATRILAI